jgi:predicted MFS family arabinose efflux permease
MMVPFRWKGSGMESARRPHYQVSFGILALGIGAFSLLQSLVVPVLSTLQLELHTSQSAVTWVLTAYLLSASVMTPILGRVGDIYGKKWVFVAALVGLAVGSVLAAVAPNLTVLIVARVIQGLGGGTMPLGFGIIRDEFPADKVAGAVGILAALTAVGGSLGIVLAGPIVNALDWHWLFWLPGIATVIAAVGAVLFVPQSPIRSPGTISWLPAVLLTGWLVALLVPLSEASEWGWGSPAVIGLLAGAVLLAAAWVWSELRAATPLIDMKMMMRPGVWTNNLVALLIGMGMYAMFAFLPEFVQTPSAAGYGFGASITRSGLMLLPSGVTMFAVGLFVGSLTRRFGGKVLVATGCLVGSVSMAMFAFAHAHEWEIFVATGILGIGFGLAFSAMAANVVAAVPSGETSVAAGMNANIRTIGGSIGAAVMASIVTAKLEPSGLPVGTGYTAGFGVMAAVVLVAALAALLIPSARRTGTAVAEAPDIKAAAVATLAMSGDAVTAESAAGETVASELGE